MDVSMNAEVLQSPAIALLCGLERDGFTVRLESDAIVIAPRSKLTPERMQQIVGQKAAVKLLLGSLDPGVLRRRDVMRQQIALAPKGCVLPALLFRSNLSYVTGRCFSCGDALQRFRVGRCWRCALAWRLAVPVPISPDLADALDGARVLA